MVVACLWMAGASPMGALDMLPHSFSRSRQFVVYAKQPALRGAIGTLGDDTKTALLNVLGLRDEWKLPIVVDLRPPEPGLPGARAPVRLILAQTGTGLKVELGLLIGDAGRGTRIRDELMRTLLLDLAYRGSAALPAGRAYTLPPPWLVEGLSAYLENEENGVSGRLFSALLPTLQTMSSTDFLANDPAGMDSTSRAVYRACAYNLVCLLMRDLAAGRNGLVAFVKALPEIDQVDANSAVALGRFFPELAAAPDSLAKWWTLGLAHLATADRYQILSVEESERRLQNVLTFSVPVSGKGGPPRTCTLADFRDIAAREDRAKVLAPVQAELMTLSGQASPLYNGIMEAYRDTLTRLVRNRTKGVGERLRELEALRKEVSKRRSNISDYVNWYEATQMPTQSNSFNDYFQMARQLDSAKVIHRPDAISAYLDSMDTEFQ